MADTSPSDPLAWVEQLKVHVTDELRLKIGAYIIDKLIEHLLLVDDLGVPDLFQTYAIERIETEGGMCSYSWHVPTAGEFQVDGTCDCCGQLRAEHRTVLVCKVDESRTSSDAIDCVRHRLDEALRRRTAKSS